MVLSVIDLHAHVLPGVDDGPRTLEQMQAVLEQAMASGISTIVAVAHANDHHYDVTRERYSTAFEKAVALIAQKGWPLTLIPAMEVRLGPHLAEGYRQGQFLAVGDSGFFCVELPTIDFPAYTLDALYMLALEGVRPFLIHPERNRGLRHHPSLVDKLMAMNILGVASMGSLTGQFGTEVQEAVWSFIERGLIQAVSTDGHSVDKRPLTLSVAHQLLVSRYGMAVAQALTTAIPQQMLKGQTIPLVPRQVLKSSPFSSLRRLFRRSALP